MNRTAIIVVLSLAAAIFIGTIGGCDLGDAITVSTPSVIQADEGLPARMTLNEAEDAFPIWKLKTETAGQQWRDNIDRSNQVRVMLETFALSQLDEFGPQLAGIPVLGTSLPLLTGLAGLLIKRPGDKTKDEAMVEQDSAWDEAFEAGKKAALEAFREARG